MQNLLRLPARTRARHFFPKGMECEIPAREDAGAPIFRRLHTMKGLILRTALAGLLLSLAVAQGGEAGRATVAAQSRPNIIIIMSDDMGFSDIGCYGGEINKPHIGPPAPYRVRFFQCSLTARCSPRP